MASRVLAAGLGMAIGLVGAALGPPYEAAGAVDLCRASSSELDLNGDGYDDAVVGDPYATVRGRVGAGSVTILLGDADRRIGEGRRVVLTQASVPGSNVETGDRFGWAVALHDVDRNGCADLLVGSPGEDWSGRADAGIAHLISFTPDGRGGPGTAQARLFDQGDLGGAVESGDQFGYAVAMGGGGDDTGAIGAPGEDLGGARDAGAVNSFSFDGEELAQSRQRTQGGRLPGTPEPGDRFGASVLVAPLWVTDGTDVALEPVVVAGAPGDTVVRGGTAVDGAGSVTTWDEVAGFEQVVTQDSADVPGSAEPGDGFGHSLAFSEPTTVPEELIPRDLAVGSPGEDVGSVRDAGSVTLFADVRQGGLQGRAVLTQATEGFAGRPETGDHFGHAVAFRADRISTLVLAIGVPDEDVGAVADAGLVQIATLTGPGRSAEASLAYTESSAGTPGRVATRSRFGATVAGVRGLAESVITVSSPYQGSGSVFVAANDGTTRAWVPGRGGVPASNGRFGWSVAGLQSQS